MANSNNPLDWTGIATEAAGSLFGFGLNQISSAQAYSRQKNLMRYQNELNRENWQMQNAYNTPAAQRKRLEAAGLNPDMMYGEGASALSSPSAPAPVSGGSAPSPIAADVDFASATQALANARNTDSHTMEQDIRNKYVEQEVLAALRESGSRTELNNEQRRGIVQSIQESQANIDALKQRLGNEKFDRVLSVINLSGQLERWQHENELTDEQKKWIGTNAMAAMIGAKGSAAQAQAMADAINLFRKPEVLRKVIDSYIAEIKKGLSDLKTELGIHYPQVVKDIDVWLKWSEKLGNNWGYPFFN